MPSWFCPQQKRCIIRRWHECFCLFAALSFNSVNYWRLLDMFEWNSIKKSNWGKERDDMQHKEKPPFTVCDACSTSPAAFSALVCNSQPTKSLHCFKTQPHPSSIYPSWIIHLLKTLHKPSDLLQDPFPNGLNTPTVNYCKANNWKQGWCSGCVSIPVWYSVVGDCTVLCGNTGIDNIQRFLVEWRTLLCNGFIVG